MKKSIFVYLAAAAGAIVLIGSALFVANERKTQAEAELAAATTGSIRDTASVPTTADETNALSGDTLASMRSGTMKKLQFHSDPKSISQVAFIDETGTEMSLDAFAGKHVLLNFWATWCAPCRKEMPYLAELQTQFQDDSFEVVTISTGRGNPVAISKFFDEIEVDNLPKYRDPSQALAREMAVLGLPITVILSPDGQEIARMQGDADWASASGKSIIAGLKAGAPLQ